MPLGFVFDINRCTGCNACQIACSLENEVDWAINWRQVVTFNPDRQPLLPTYHLSLACNHCADPPCMNFCPARAYIRDKTSGIVRLDNKKCIGCKYCSWACPYDAPRYNRATGVMEKCTFCRQRLEEKSDPACVALCPTGALNFSYAAAPYVNGNVNGFSDYNIGPSIEIIPLRCGRQISVEEDMPFDSELVERFRSVIKTPESTITPATEWPLIVFSLIAALLTGLRGAEFFTGSIISPDLFVITGIVSMLISLLHLGRKMRALRAVLNWRRSWLSREIILFTFFVLLCLLNDRIFPQSKILPFIAVIAGFSALFCMDRVYSVLIKQQDMKWHSAGVLLTGIYFMTLLAGPGWLVLVTGLLKLFLFLKRYGWPDIIGLARIIAGIILPLGLWFTFQGAEKFYIAASAMAGEIIDRSLFYLALHTATPAGRMNTDLEQALHEVQPG